MAMDGLPIYMDYGATTPCDPRVLKAMLPFFSTQFGNPASYAHPYGWMAREAVSIAREQVAALLDAEPAEVIFTSGATESINLALKGIYDTYRSKGKHVVTCQTEHQAVLDCCTSLERQGADITYLPVDHTGRLDPDRFKAALRSDTILVALMLANNETGLLHPIASLATMAKERGILFFCDATQAVGKIPVSVQELGVDVLACSAHKIYGPKGTGALYIRRKRPRVRLTAQLEGGGQENGLRSGTLNVPGIVGFGEASQLAATEMHQDGTRLLQVRQKLEALLDQSFSIQIHAASGERLPNITNIGLIGYEGAEAVAYLRKRIAVSFGSACHSQEHKPSHVLLAMGVSPQEALQSLRFSLGRPFTDQEFQAVCTHIQTAANNPASGAVT